MLQRLVRWPKALAALSAQVATNPWDFCSNRNNFGCQAFFTLLLLLSAQVSWHGDWGLASATNVYEYHVLMFDAWCGLVIAQVSSSFVLVLLGAWVLCALTRLARVVVVYVRCVEAACSAVRVLCQRW